MENNEPIIIRPFDDGEVSVFIVTPLYPTGLCGMMAINDQFRATRDHTVILTVDQLSEFIKGHFSG